MPTPLGRDTGRVRVGTTASSCRFVRKRQSRFDLQLRIVVANLSFALLYGLYFVYRVGNSKRRPTTPPRGFAPEEDVAAAMVVAYGLERRHADRLLPGCPTHGYTATCGDWVSSATVMVIALGRAVPRSNAVLRM
jgi:hypothetical protein